MSRAAVLNNPSLSTIQAITQKEKGINILFLGAICKSGQGMKANREG
jgi:hypothetical protein